MSPGEGYGQSLGEVRTGLCEVSERLRTAYRYLRTAEQRLAEAVALLSELDRSHHDRLLSPELLRADQVLTRGLELINSGADTVAAFEARL